MSCHGTSCDISHLIHLMYLMYRGRIREGEKHSHEEKYEKLPTILLGLQGLTLTLRQRQTLFVEPTIAATKQAPEHRALWDMIPHGHRKTGGASTDSGDTRARSGVVSTYVAHSTTAVFRVS